MRFLVCVTVLASIVFLGRAVSDEPKAPDFKLTNQEQTLLDLTNVERKKNDLAPLKASSQLFKAARAHSVNMAKQEKLDHELDGKSPFDRIKDAKYKYRTAGENIAMSFPDPSMADILKLWLESPPHRANILNDKFTEIGLGIAKNGKGEVYATQVFGKPFDK